MKLQSFLFHSLKHEANNDPWIQQLEIEILSLEKTIGLYTYRQRDRGHRVKVLGTASRLNK